jgi:hypothetical protein
MMMMLRPPAARFSYGVTAKHAALKLRQRVNRERPSSIVAPMATSASSRSAAQAARAGRSADRRSDHRGPEPN